MWSKPRRRSRSAFRRSGEEVNFFFSCPSTPLNRYKQPRTRRQGGKRLGLGRAEAGKLAGKV